MNKTELRKVMKSLLITLVAVVVFALPAKAAVAGDEMPGWVQQAVAIKVPTYEKDVTAVVLVDDSVVTIDSDGRISEIYNYAVRVLQREGREYAKGGVGYIPDVEKVK